MKRVLGIQGQRPYLNLYCTKGHYRKSNRIGAKGTCLDCRQNYNKQFKNIRAEYCHNYYITKRPHLKKKFGMSLEEYNKLFLTQNGLCLGCYKHQSELSAVLYVDHSHKTGRVRGLLCRNCNFLLGHSFDNPITLRRLADYVERYA